MSNLFSTHYSSTVFALFFTFLTILYCGEDAAIAANGVSGRYLSATGNNIVLSLTIAKPSPANLIVEQYLSPGNEIIATSPTAKKIDAGKSQVKWLFRNVNSDNLTLSIQLKAPLKGRPRTMVRFNDPNGGKFTELSITP